MQDERGRDNRGHPPEIRDGEVHGSGAGAGGGGTPEDIDADSTAGSGADVMPRAKPDRPATGADAPSHGSR